MLKTEKEKQPRSGNAVVSLILGLLFWMPLFNYFFGLGAVYFGFKALSEIRDGGNRRIGKLFALCGITLGLVPYYFGALSVLLNIFHTSQSEFAGVILFLPPVTLLVLFFVMKRYKLV